MTYLFERRSAEAVPDQRRLRDPAVHPDRARSWGSGTDAPAAARRPGRPGARAGAARRRRLQGRPGGGARHLQRRSDRRAPAAGHGARSTRAGAAVWKALTDQAAYRAWAAPASFIDFRVGGLVEVAFDPKGKAGDPANLKQQITAYVPGRLIAFRNLPSTRGAAGRVRSIRSWPSSWS